MEILRGEKMKYIVILLAAFAASACSSTGTKLERIEANEAAIANLQSVVTMQEEVLLELQTRPENTSCPAECVIKIDRAFEKSQYK